MKKTRPGPGPEFLKLKTGPKKGKGKDLFINKQTNPVQAMYTV